MRATIYRYNTQKPIIISDDEEMNIDSSELVKNLLSKEIMMVSTANETLICRTEDVAQVLISNEPKEKSSKNIDEFDKHLAEQAD